jgi:beta-glucosidase
MTGQEKPDINELDTRIDQLLKKLTLREKVSLLSGKNAWQTVPIERLNIPSLTMTDGPHGVRANRTGPERISGPATSFPTGVSMASTWNPDLIEKVGEALAEETLAMGCQILLGPCVNIVRTPLAGRNFESYSEDPFLAGYIGTAWVKGLQRNHVGASLKHYACNNQELERHRGDSIVDERTLREIFLAQFEMIVKQASPWTVMCSYNRINGTYASQNNFLLNDILKDEWGFEGVVISDWGANHTTVESVAGGLDIEMPGPAHYYGRLLESAVRNWQIDISAVNEAARRVLRMIILSGRMDDEDIPAGAVNTVAHQNLARKVAEESITLLKNENNILPVSENIKSIAVIGPNADECRIGGGGSSYLECPYKVSPLEAVQFMFGNTVSLSFEQGCDNVVQIPALKSKFLRTPDGQEQGLLAEFYNNTRFEGSPDAVRVDPKLDDWRIMLPPGIDSVEFSARWQGQLRMPVSGRYALAVQAYGEVRLYLDGEPVISKEKQEQRNQNPDTVQTYVYLDADKSYDLVVEYSKTKDIDFTNLYVRALYAPEPDYRMENAIQFATESDMVLFFGGMPTGWETEGTDRPHMRLPGNQDELISKLAQVNDKVVVVLNCGSPVEMPWIDEVAAVLIAYYPGLEGGNAIANILSGDVNPSGKLSVTYPKRYQDNPSFINYPGTKEVRYGEGIFVGYRYYDYKEVEPLFPFGHGLSYTTFAYSHFDVPARVQSGDQIPVSVTVKNTGKHTGKEVVQLYVHDCESSLVRPPKELKGFAKVELAPGESKIVSFSLNKRDLSFYDPYHKMWVAEAGDFEILVGPSSSNILLKKQFTLA